MGLKVKEFRSTREYSSWLNKSGNSVRVVNVSTTKRWSLFTGFLGDNKTYTVTYEDQPLAAAAVAGAGITAGQSSNTFCTSCGQHMSADARFCPACGASLPGQSPQPSAEGVGAPTQISSGGQAKFIAALVLAIVAAVLLKGWAALAGFLAVFGFFYVVPRLKIPPRKKLMVVGAVVGIVLVVEVVEVVISDFEERAAQRQADVQKNADAKVAQERARKAAEEQAAAQQRFNAMTPAEHLAEAKKLLQPGAIPQSESQGFLHIGAIPAGAFEAHTAADIKSRFLVEKQKRAAEAARQSKIKAAEAERAKAATDEAARIAFAKIVENQMLDEGWNMDVTAIGAKHTTLRMKWALVSKVMAHQMSQKSDIFDTARQLGFKRLELTDGFDETWTWNLDSAKRNQD
ncbi:MAG TPA: zinc ribbon domain-containing protein [Terriglobales bacterium]|nr:zinc ribbon domain-containing protein [Terriglobales bacterium]